MVFLAVIAVESAECTYPQESLRILGNALDPAVGEFIRYDKVIHLILVTLCYGVGLVTTYESQQ